MSTDYDDDYEDDYEYEFDFEEEDVGYGKPIAVTPETLDDAVRNFCLVDGKRTVSFAILTDDNILHTRWDQPCYGELCLYGSASRNLPDVDKPGDLNTPFPDGTPITIVGPYTNHLNHPSQDAAQRILEYIAGGSSPYRSITKTVLRHEGKIIGFTFPANQEPTKIVSMLMYTNMLCGWVYNLEALDKWLPEATESQKMFLLPRLNIYNTGNNPTFSVGSEFLWGSKYHISPLFSVESFFNSVLRDLTGGTFSERYSYNRPEIEYIFGKDDESFIKLAGRIRDELKSKYSRSNGWYTVAPASEAQYIHREFLEHVPGYASQP